jgi:hypothetical protein
MRRAAWRWALAGLLLGLWALSLGARAQMFGQEYDWVEEPAPPPQLEFARVIPLTGLTMLPQGFGVDPGSITIGRQDRVVRYVATVVNGNVRNAFYEGIRCINGQMRRYAIWRPDGTWNELKDSQWRTMAVADGQTRHAMVLAREAICNNSATNDLRTIEQRLRTGRPIER